jgi:23S rRNA pseudouridine2457 synthase
MLIAFHKPYGVISQFTPDGSAHRTLSEFGFPKNVYALGRLDADSEGLLLLSDEKNLTAQLLLPENAHARIYWAQVEPGQTKLVQFKSGQTKSDTAELKLMPTETDLNILERGIVIEGYKTKPCQVRLLIAPPNLPPRQPPIRIRKLIPTTWLELTLTEGKNRQVRKMTAAIGFPTLRLIRVQIGNLPLGNLQSGQWQQLSDEKRHLAFDSLPPIRQSSDFTHP